MPVLVVQMGHAGRTTGATGAPGEQAFALAVGAECARLLARDGWTVRPIAADPSASLYRGDAFFAIHADGSTNPAVRGASVGYQTPEGAALAHAWRDAYARRGFDGPWHPDNYTTNLARYYGVREAIAQGNRRACIVECGTITNAADRAIMDPTRVALALGDALGIGASLEADVNLDDTGIPYPYRDQGDPNMSVRRALGHSAYVSADMAKDDQGRVMTTLVQGSNRLSVPALRDDVDRLHDKVDELVALVRQALGSPQ